MEELFSKEFWAIVASKQREGQRKGQAVFNTAYDMFPKEVGEIVSTKWDPFYNDSRVSLFLEGLVTRLTNPEG